MGVMSFHVSTLTKGLFRRFPRKPAPAKLDHRVRLELAALEDRTVPTVRLMVFAQQPSPSLTTATRVQRLPTLKFPTNGRQRECGVNSDREVHRWLVSARPTRRSSNSRP